MPSPSPRRRTFITRSRFACIARGIHILVEKPIASLGRGGARHCRRRAPPRRRDLDGGACSNASTRQWPPSSRRYRAKTSFRSRSPGLGPFSAAKCRTSAWSSTLAVHDIDLIRWFTESDIVEVQPPALQRRRRSARISRCCSSAPPPAWLAHINTKLADTLQGAERHRPPPRGKYIMGDLLTRQVTECFGFKPDGSYSMRPPAGRP